ncbi:Gfo/Idh/MocA family protein [Aestuariibaculum suncheonense]|uniref:Gfo/Idh/MocA family oxidoreductase n=1 Tax=Aestuariibaculum suncheonense TaxID=1028745 RepID=A0A8J6Q6N1_9FLAO|nr:Gfo/Idh/MocA family oxidoreductase [Aestuariibaculum suncheonense]MBD0834971.1 Gfo/Idh/MocA family oxidoreductase [Aestuariibaculum suncheonense]
MIKNNTVIKWGIIGCGDVTEVKSGPAYKLTKGFELVAVMRRNADKVKDYAKRHQIEKYYTNADELINDPDIDAVYIATPPDSHMHYALKVAEAGKICCIEKPMAPSYQESLTIYNAFKDKNIPLFVAYYRRSLPRFTQIKEWIDNNEIGEVRHINWEFSAPASVLDKSGEYNWRTDAEIAPGGYFDDLASHGLDFFTFILGNIKEAKGISVNQQNNYSAKDAITACWIHENNITGSAFWNFDCNERLDRVSIHGSKGSIEFAVFHEKPIKLKNDRNKETLHIEHPKHIQIYHVEDMRNMVLKSNFTHPSLGVSALHTSWVMDKILGNL